MLQEIAMLAGSAVGAGFLAKKSLVRIGQTEIGVIENKITGSLRPLLDRKETVAMNVLATMTDEATGETVSGITSVETPAAKTGLQARFPFLTRLHVLPRGVLNTDPSEIGLTVPVIYEGEQVLVTNPNLAVVTRIIPNMAPEVIRRFGGEAGLREAINNVGRATANAVVGGRDYSELTGGSSLALAHEATAIAASNMVRQRLADLVSIDGVLPQGVDFPDEFVQRVARAAGDKLAIEAVGADFLVRRIQAEKGNLIILDSGSNHNGNGHRASDPIVAGIVAARSRGGFE